MLVYPTFFQLFTPNHGTDLLPVNLISREMFHQELCPGFLKMCCWNPIQKEHTVFKNNQIFQFQHLLFVFALILIKNKFYWFLDHCILFYLLFKNIPTYLETRLYKSRWLLLEWQLCSIKHL